MKISVRFFYEYENGSDKDIILCNVSTTVYEIHFLAWSTFATQRSGLLPMFKCLTPCGMAVTLRTNPL